MTRGVGMSLEEESEGKMNGLRDSLVKNPLPFGQGVAKSRQKLQNQHTLVKSCPIFRQGGRFGGAV